MSWFTLSNCFGSASLRLLSQFIGYDELGKLPIELILGQVGEQVNSHSVIIRQRDLRVVVLINGSDVKIENGLPVY